MNCIVSFAATLRCVELRGVPRALLVMGLLVAPVVCSSSICDDLELWLVLVVRETLHGLLPGIPRVLLGQVVFQSIVSLLTYLARYQMNIRASSLIPTLANFLSV